MSRPSCAVVRSCVAIVVGLLIEMTTHLASRTVAAAGIAVCRARKSIPASNPVCLILVSAFI